MTEPWLAVVGIEETGRPGLAAEARALVDRAEVLVGGDRHLAMIAPPTTGPGPERLIWPTPMTDLMPAIADRRGRRVVVLATGDPLCYGVGALLTRRFPVEEMRFVPARSAFSLAAARLGWPLAEVETVTLHGRPLADLALALYPGARILALSAGAETPAAAAGLLTRAGYGRSRLTVLARLGGPAERRLDGAAADWAHPPPDPLNTLAIACVADPGTMPRPRVPGLPDDAFAHDGQITKREVRAVTLAALAPCPGERLWDIGAGAGSIAIEWLRSDRRTQAIAVERDPARCRRIAENAARLGVPRLEVVEGAAPAALDGLAPPDAVFLGGGVAVPGVLAAAWAALRPGGRLVANAVTLAGEEALLAAAATHGGDLGRLAVSRAATVGGHRAWRPLMPVTHWAAVKPDRPI